MNIPIFNREYILKESMFHCYVSLLECTNHSPPKESIPWFCHTPPAPCRCDAQPCWLCDPLQLCLGATKAPISWEAFNMARSTFSSFSGAIILGPQNLVVLGIIPSFSQFGPRVTVWATPEVSRSHLVTLSMFVHVWGVAHALKENTHE